MTDEAVCPDWMNVFRYTDGFQAHDCLTEAVAEG